MELLNYRRNLIDALTFTAKMKTKECSSNPVFSTVGLISCLTINSFSLTDTDASPAHRIIGLATIIMPPDLDTYSKYSRDYAAWR